MTDERLAAEQYTNCDNTDYKVVSDNNNYNCDIPVKKYNKTDMVINSLVSYLRGLHSDRTDEWLDKVLDYYSRE